MAASGGTPILTASSRPCFMASTRVRVKVSTSAGSRIAICSTVMR